MAYYATMQSTFTYGKNVCNDKRNGKQILIITLSATLPPTPPKKIRIFFLATTFFLLCFSGKTNNFARTCLLTTILLCRYLGSCPSDLRYPSRICLLPYCGYISSAPGISHTFFWGRTTYDWVLDPLNGWNGSQQNMRFGSGREGVRERAYLASRMPNNHLIPFPGSPLCT